MDPEQISPLQEVRTGWEPQLPTVLRGAVEEIAVEKGQATGAVGGAEAIREHFPRTFGRPLLRLVPGRGRAQGKPLQAGVVLSGGQAPGGHNVIAGLFDGLKRAHADSTLYGFLGGPRGLFQRRYRELSAEVIRPYRNTGGFDLIGAGRDKIETPEQLADCKATCEALGLDGLVIVGGDDSNTNAAVLAEYFLEQGVATAVVGVPKTIDGDLRGGEVEASFGFDTATKVYAELIGNICRDSKSAAKYWHFVKLMGRNASHVTLECALQTRVNIALIGEEVQERGMTLTDVVEQVADVVRRRADAGKNYGVCLVPEGLIEFIPEIRELIAELNGVLHEHERYLESMRLFSDKQEFVNQKLGRDGSYVFSSLPLPIQQQLLLERDAHGNVQVSKIDTEALLVERVSERVAEWRTENRFSGKFQVQGHFFGYEGRCAAPSNFDANYTNALGRTAAALIGLGRTGYICTVRNLAQPPAQWSPGGAPLTSMMQMERRKGREVPVIGKFLVRTEGEPFRAFAAARARWEVEDHYVYPGAIQYFGPPEVSEPAHWTLRLEQGSAERYG